MVVSSWGERVGMDTLGGESDGSNNVDGWNRGRVDVNGGCEGCTKLDARGTCRWSARRPPLPRPIMDGTLTSVINDGGLIDGLKDVDGYSVECMRWSSSIARKTSIVIEWVSFKLSEITIYDMIVICTRKWNMRHLHII